MKNCLRTGASLCWNQMSHDMIFPTMWYVLSAKAQTAFARRLNILWLISHWPNIIWSSKLKMGMHRLVWVYTCQNATLLKITCRGSNAFHLFASEDYLQCTSCSYELSMTFLTLRPYLIMLIVLMFMSQSTIFQSCQEEFSWVEPVLSRA